MGTLVVTDDNLLAEARRLAGLKETDDVMREALLWNRDLRLHQL